MLRGRACTFRCAAAAFLAAALLAALPAAGADRMRANFAAERASAEARSIADWVVDSHDHRDRPFIIVDKPHAKVFVFDASGHLLGAAPALLGLTVGDRMVAVGSERETSELAREDKTTPAGRFWAQLGRSTRGEDVLWVDYDTGLSLHRVLTTRPHERRLERLKTPSVADNRISAGCINVPKQFYEKVVAPAFRGLVGAVYILPDSGSAREMLNAYPVDDPPQQRAAYTPPAPR